MVMREEITTGLMRRRLCTKLFRRGSFTYLQGLVRSELVAWITLAKVKIIVIRLGISASSLRGMTIGHWGSDFKLPLARNLCW